MPINAIKQLSTITTTATAMLQLEDQIQYTIEQAISAAAHGNWDEAIRLNSDLLQYLPDDIPTLNRLGRAYLSTCQYDQALGAYQQVIAADPKNIIANKNIKKINLLKNSKQPNLHNHKSEFDPSQFIRQSSQSKIISLINIAPSDTCVSLNCGELLNLAPSRRLISVKDQTGRYIGRIPGDISFKLNQMIKTGHQFTAYIKSAQPLKVQIIIQQIQTPRHTSVNIII